MAILLTYLFVRNVHYERCPDADRSRRTVVCTQVTVETGLGVGDSWFGVGSFLPGEPSKEDVFSAGIPANPAAGAFLVIYFRRHILTSCFGNRKPEIGNRKS
jgi:hypothetical protein